MPRFTKAGWRTVIAAIAPAFLPTISKKKVRGEAAQTRPSESRAGERATRGSDPEWGGVLLRERRENYRAPVHISERAGVATRFGSPLKRQLFVFLRTTPKSPTPNFAGQMENFKRCV